MKENDFEELSYTLKQDEHVTFKDLPVKEYAKLYCLIDARNKIESQIKEQLCKIKDGKL